MFFRKTGQRIRERASNKPTARVHRIAERTNDTPVAVVAADPGLQLWAPAVALVTPYFAVQAVATSDDAALQLQAVEQLGDVATRALSRAEQHATYTARADRPPGAAVGTGMQCICLRTLVDVGCNRKGRFHPVVREAAWLAVGRWQAARAGPLVPLWGGLPRPSAPRFSNGSAPMISASGPGTGLGGGQIEGLGSFQLAMALQAESDQDPLSRLVPLKSAATKATPSRLQLERNQGWAGRGAGAWIALDAAIYEMGRFWWDLEEDLPPPAGIRRRGVAAERLQPKGVPPPRWFTGDDL